MKKLKQLMSATLMGVVVSVGHAQTSVPALWNVDPWTDGAYLEQFAARPDWAPSGSASVAVRDARSDRPLFPVQGTQNVLTFSSLGMTNNLTGAKIQLGTPLFVDMRCKLTLRDATQSTPPPNTIFSFFANANSNLVAYVGVQCQTNTAITVLTNDLYSIMIRFATDKFDIFFTNSVNPVLSFNATTNTQIGKIVVSGAGEMDDLFVSYGDPRRTTGYNAETPKPFLTPNDEQKVINNWVANQAKTNSALTGQDSITQDNATKYYLTDTALSTADFVGELGVASFTYDPTTYKVVVDVTLKTSASNRKTGKINGVLKLKGAATYADAKAGTWPLGVLGTTAITPQDFTDGVAHYTFTLQNGASKFFLPVIVSDIK